MNCFGIDDLSDEANSAVGSLIGTFVGDALGMPVEGWSHSRIRDRYGQVTSMHEARGGAGTYTDDTQMMIATAKSLIECEGIDAEHLAQSFLAHHDRSRGYGQGTTRVFEKWTQGVDTRTAAREIFDGGSFGNGGSMRIAPVGIWYAGQPEALREAIDVACGITHAHPLGLGSSYLQAFVVGEVFRDDLLGPSEATAFIDLARDSLPDRWDEDERISTNLRRAKQLLEQNADPVEPGRVAREIGCSSKAFESVPAAIYAALANSSSFKKSLTYAVGIGGDTDTIGAMAGAIAGALHGLCAVPENWWSALENGPDGRDRVVELGRRVCQLRP